jgi:hypothetical protein
MRISSTFPLSFNQLSTIFVESVEEGISLLFQKVEDKHGWPLVAHSLAYLTASKVARLLIFSKFKYTQYTNFLDRS